jgi:ribosomal protein S18 acetylase RimI-like enzyme
VDPTLVLALDLGRAAVCIEPSFRPLPRREWLDAYARHADIGETAQSLHAMLLLGIRTDHLFGSVDVDGASAACGMAVAERELVGLFDLVTHPDARRRGHARALVNGLLAWARQRAAQHAYLQVMEANAAARPLYESLGFTELYRYWYRVAP